MVRIFIQRGYSISSEVIVSHLLRNIYIYIYIRYQFLNSADVVMSSGNQNFHLTFFVKSGALQFGIRVVLL